MKRDVYVDKQIKQKKHRQQDLHFTDDIGHKFIDVNHACCLNVPDNSCGSPHVPTNSNIQLPKIKERYRHHDTLALGCGTGYKKVGQALAKCENGIWTFPEFNCTSKNTIKDKVGDTPPSGVLNTFLELWNQCHDFRTHDSLTRLLLSWMGYSGLIILFYRILPYHIRNNFLPFPSACFFLFPV